MKRLVAWLAQQEWDVTTLLAAAFFLVAVAAVTSIPAMIVGRVEHPTMHPLSLTWHEWASAWLVGNGYTVGIATMMYGVGRSILALPHWARRSLDKKKEVAASPNLENEILAQLDREYPADKDAP